ncbi:MAG: thiamine phosphate synthase [Vicinamibacterales bacterium]
MVTDRHRAVPDARTPAETLTGLERAIDHALDAGVDAVQIREPDVAAAALRALAARLVARTGGRAAILVNDRVDVALASGAHVHLRADAPAEARVRPLLPPGAWISRAVHDSAEAAGHAGADALVFGHVFPSASKPGVPAAGVAGIAAVRRATSRPVIAIGGVTVANAAACAAAGADGVAAIGMFLPAIAQEYPGGLHGVVRDLRAALESGRRGR